MTPHPYQDPSLDTSARVEDLLGRMSLEDKAGQLSQYFYLGAVGDVPEDFDYESLPPEHQAFARQPAVLKAAIASGGTGSVLFVTDPATTNELQRSAVEQSPHGIPLLFGFDVIHGLRTIFPASIGMAASWDPELVRATQAVAAREARAVGIRWTFAPMVDIARDPRWGRIIEGAGEDPFLGSAIAAAHVRGFQGNFGPENILAGPKHFAGYGAARGGRDYDDVEISDNELWNVYLPPFTAAINAGASTIMSAYMDLNGVPASGNHHLLTDILRDELGFDGFVVSDNNAVKSLVTQHFASSSPDAAARAVTAGLDMEMCLTEPAFASLPEAVAEGLIQEDRIDAAVRRVLTAKFRLGLFEAPYVDETAAPGVLADASHRDLARTSAERSIVLLKNDGVLPLRDTNAKSIAVIGQLADSKRDTLGPWVFDHDTDDTVTILEGITSRLPDGANVLFAPGAGVPARTFPSMFDAMDATVVGTPADHDDDVEIDRAVAIAAEAEVAIVVVGERQNQIGENASRSTLDLPGRQLEQLQRIVATGTPVIVLVMSGRPLDLRWADEHAAAIAEVWYPGSRGGHAVASVLFGDVSPAARLPFSWPRHVGHVPLVYSHLRTFQPENQGTRYWDEESTPLYPFGHGLSYSTFSYHDLGLDRPVIERGETVTVSLDVTNDSDHAGDDVVQLYIHQRHGASSRPVKELKGFQRVSFAPKETKTVTFTLGPDELRHWSAATGGWTQDRTHIDIWVGGSSADTDLSTILVVS